MTARNLEEIRPPAPSAGPVAALRTTVRPRGGAHIESIVRRCTAFAALGWLGYVGYLLRDCPSSGAICERPSVAAAAAGIAVGVVALGHLIGWAASGASRRIHGHEPAH